MNKLYYLAQVFVFVIGLTSCASELTKESEGNYETRASELETQVASIDSYEVKNGRNVNRLYLGENIIDVEVDRPLPSIFEKRVVYSSLDPVPLSTLIKYLTNHYGIRVHVTSDAGATIKNTYSSADVSAGNDSSGGNGEASTSSESSISISYSGSLRGFLDMLTSKTNTFWRYEDHHVVIFQQVTKTYTIKAFAGTSTTNNQFVGNIISAGDSESETKLASGTEAADVSIWKEIEADIRTKLSPSGRISIQQSTGRITISDTQFAIHQIDAYVKALNEDLEKQVYLQVHVYRLDRDDRNDYGIDWNLVFSDNKTGVNFSSGLFGSVPASTGDVNIVDAGSHFNATQLLFKSLSKYGKVSEVTTHRSMSLNGQTVPVKNQTQRSYLESASLTTSDAGLTTSLTPGTVSEGVALSLTPKVMSGRDVMLQMGITLSTIDSIDEITSGGTTLQMPTVSSKSTLQRVSIRSGHSLVVSGLERSLDDSQYAGVGRRGSMALGGRQITRIRRSTTIIVVTPKIVEN